MKKRIEMVIKITFRPGSLFQGEFFENAIRNMLISLGDFLHGSHKGNSFVWRINSKTVEDKK